ncbi:hypothetical protein B0H34DRAFT_782088 [Crassisporium funariophilum]|nr:hypothetical protein B0H34DRAFT_782088 [Crassisporium funariophilum]
MKFTSISTVVSLLFMSTFSATSATPMHLESRDVFVPPILYPHQGTVWTRGQHHNVTWDTSSRPVNITNKVGIIMLRKGGLTTPLILENRFDILLGRITVTVPWVDNGDDYQLVLFGDSGNFSPMFTINGA